MSSISLPLRAKNEADFPQLKKIDKDIVADAVLFGADNQTAFMRFHPEYVSTDGKTMNQAGKQASRQFWSWGKVKDYRQSYEQTVQEFLNGKKSIGRITDTEGDGNSDKRKDRAIRKLVSDCLAAIEDNVALDPETLKDFVTMAKALGVLKDEEEQQIRPIRFLPTLCASECRYRLFVENAVKGGDLVDECQYCRALRFATENGYHDDATKRLDIPQEILDAEPENTVSTLDILSGKIDN